MTEDICGDAREPKPGQSATCVPRTHSVKSRTKGYVLLDSTWASILGVHRSGGVYRITHWQLRERLAQLQPSYPETVLLQSVVPGDAGPTTNKAVHHGPAANHTHSHFIEFFKTDAPGEFVEDFLVRPA